MEVPQVSWSSEYCHTKLALQSTAKRAKSRWSGTKFGQIVEGAGLILGGVDQENLLSEEFLHVVLLHFLCSIVLPCVLLEVDPAVFQRDVSSAFKRAPTTNSVSSWEEDEVGILYH